MTRVFVDASAWVPMALSRDQNAPRLQQAIDQLRGQPVEFVTTTWTLYEALAVVQRPGKRYATDLHRRALRIANVVFVGRSVERDALWRFLEWSDESASVVDHANALVAENTGCDAIMSFDADFVPLARAAGLALLTGGTDTGAATKRRRRLRSQ